MRIFLFSGILACAFARAQGQSAEWLTQKTGYTDTEYIFAQMPEAKRIKTELTAHTDQLQSQIDAKGRELKTKYDAYVAMPANTPDLIKADKERELQLLQEGLERFRGEAETSIQNKQVTLMEPVITKIANAIDGVAKENGFAFVLNSRLAGTDILLFGDDHYDISELVLKKLGVAPPPRTAAK